MPAFIETQFPIARLSAESYKERKANNGQTLTRLGKWWGRKPLILARAAIIGMLMPASGDARKDREMFLKILTMDDAGALARWKADERFSWDELRTLATPLEREQWDALDCHLSEALAKLQDLRTAEPAILPDVAAAAAAREAIAVAEVYADHCRRALSQCIAALQARVFNDLPYARRIALCERPENIDGPTPEAWSEINAHLGTTAGCLSELIEQLGQRQFGRRPRVGDSFCGGGSIPFEAARIGCDAFGSDLNPVAGLLTWASLNLLGGGSEVQEEVMRVQAEALAAADRQVTEWGIEHNDRGERADAYLYCVEVKPEGCDYFIPLAPSWLIGEKSKVVARWRRVPGSDRLMPEIEVVSADEVKRYKEKQGATVIDSRVVDPFDPARSWSLEALRGPEGLRRWSNEDLVPRPGDAFQERLYCIRWAKTVVQTLPNGKQKKSIVRRYAAPEAADLEREAKVLELLRERFDGWQREGFIPSRRIPEGGDETARLYRERGWTHWHHLFTPRQLLTHGLLAELAFLGLESDSDRWSNAQAVSPSSPALLPAGEKGEEPPIIESRKKPLSPAGRGVGVRGEAFANPLTPDTKRRTTLGLALSREARIGCLLGLGRIVNWDSRLCLWMSNASNEGGSHVFNSQALNTFFNFSNRPISKLDTAWPIFNESSENRVVGDSTVTPIDARDLREICDLWITDPPYADAVNYHELADFFLAWYDKQLTKAFPDWTPDARAELAVRGDGDDFRRSMVEIYKNLARHMPDNGLQMVMFTHQNPSVWADLGMILWAAGLKATAAWTISTETSAGIKKGNYVQGTVCLVLRKRTGNEPGFLDEVYPLVEDEVKRQIASMQALDEDGEPNFNDADYQLAAYAAALKVLTQYGTLDGKDVEHEVFAVRARNEKSDFQIVIERALGIACDTLIPRGLDQSWRDLSLVERYVLRALDIESRGERRKGMYEELARGFGLTDIRPLLKSDKANGTRIFTPSGLGASLLVPLQGAASAASALPTGRGRASASGPHPFAASPLRHLLFAIRETAKADNSPEPGRQYLRDTFGQGYWGKREGLILLLDWLATLGNGAGMSEWAADSDAARILAGRLRNDQA